MVRECVRMEPFFDLRRRIQTYAGSTERAQSTYDLLKASVKEGLTAIEDRAGGKGGGGGGGGRRHGAPRAPPQKAGERGGGGKNG